MDDRAVAPPETLLEGLRLLERAAEQSVAGELDQDRQLVEQIRAILLWQRSQMAMLREIERSQLGRMEQRVWNFLLLPFPLPGQWHFPLTGWMFLLLGAGLWALVDPRMLLVLGAMLVPCIGWMLWSDARGRARFAAAREPRCRRCQYNLTGAQDALPQELVGAGSGPRRCPECGSPWPCVPAVNG